MPNTTPFFGSAAGSGALTADSGMTDSLIAVRIDSDGSFVAIGSWENPADIFDNGNLVVKALSSGELDSSFSSNGINNSISADGKYGGFNGDVTTSENGSILIASDTTWVGIVKLKENGSIDTSFSGDGVASLSEKVATPISIIEMSDGKISMLGQDLYGSTNYILKFTSAGVLDKSFSGDGIASIAESLTDFGWNVDITSQVEAGDGKLYVAGGNRDGFMLARYNANGSLDTSFNGTGFALTASSGTHKIASAISLQSDGKAILVGYTDAGTQLVRYNTDGSLDNSFDTDGVVVTNISGDETVLDVVIDSNDKVLVAGVVYENSQKSYFIARYNTDGSLDSSFDTDGILRSTGLSSGYFSPIEIGVTSDNKIMLVGTQNNDVVAMRFNTDGSVDTSYGVAGTLDGSAEFTSGGSAVALDSSVSIYDAEMTALNSGNGNYNGASITLARNGGANADDVFSALGNLTLSGGNAVVSGTTVGTFTNTGGTLTISFNANATQALVNTTLSSLAYANTADEPEEDVTISWTFSDGTNTVNDTTSVTIYPVPYTERLGTAALDKLTGDESNEFLKGLEGKDVLKGMAGNDRLDGGVGLDKMYGGAGDDIYVVDTLKELVAEKANEGTDTVRSSVNFTLGNHVEKLILTGTGNINGTGNKIANTLNGNTGNNILNGGAGDDIISGSTGNDTIMGHVGNDTLTGGDGNDLFVFNTKLNALANIDTITDFVSGTDDLKLAKSVFSKLGAKGDLAAGKLVSEAGATAHDADDFLLFDTSTGNLYYDADGSGIKAAVQIATLTGVASLAVSDVVVF